MNNIPNELYLKIFKLLEKKELKTVRLISKRCKDISTKNAQGPFIENFSCACPDF